MKTPQLDEKKIWQILDANKVPRDQVCILAIRGYYLDSMGVVGENDRGIYDDAMFVVWPDGIARYQANTDPNGFRKGSGTGSNKGMAMLKSGIHRFGTGKHKRTVAFRQCEPFTVTRDGNPPYDHTGWHAIDLHSGGYSSPSSLGCQTLPAQTWAEFRSQVYSLLERYKNPIRKNDRDQSVRSFDYILIDEKKVKQGDLTVSSRYLR